MNSREYWNQTVAGYGLNFISFMEFVQKKKVGKGDFGTIYLTTWTSTSERVALKRISVNEENEEAIKIFLKELSIHNSSKHDRIIKLLGISRDTNDSSDCYLIMEFADGGDLRSYLSMKKDILEWEEKIRLSTQIAEGVSYLHNELNVIHRDLHTKNILIRNSNIKISDFGLSKCLGSTTTINSKVQGILPFIDP
ncbi:1049_t:CDS:2 [Acaulospora colombiana]|uniref:1049_t:CDS:1 n=1 Tax=Acaulospora colombiana TaxID=27376 RepID=A0ACA9JYM2_9GLOM|nr:1049_t:CDS:2 [Acaulospora colombiana]